MAMSLRTCTRRISLRPITHRHARSYAKKAPSPVPHSVPKSSERTQTHPDGDFRPPWFYTTTHILTYTSIPVVGLYCIFLADWGDRDHVFTPPRRWLERQKASFFSLSPAEEELAKSNTDDHAKS